MKTGLRIMVWVLVLVATMLSGNAQDKAGHMPLAQKAVLDLRATNLDAKPIALNGEWLFYWKQLLQPGTTTTTGSSTFVDYPSLWKKTTTQQAITSRGYATYALTVLLPHNRP